MSQRLRLFSQTAVIVTGLILLYALGQWVSQTFQKPGHMDVLDSQAMDMTVKPPEGAMPVETETVEKTRFDSAVTYTGSALAYTDIPISPRTEGWIVSLSGYPGDRVKQGQVLAQLDTRELTARLQSVQYRESKAKGAIQSAQANLAFWQNKIERAKTLATAEAITREEFEDEHSQFQAAQSGYDQALAELNASRAETRAQSIVSGYTTITAPISGVITERSLTKGALASAGMQILRIAQLSPLRIQANVAQSAIENIKLGDSVRIWRVPSNASDPVEAKVSAIFPVADSRSRTTLVEAVIPNTDQRFLPGDYARMMILTGQKEDALTVSNNALITRDQQQAVWVMKNGHAELRYVTTGDTNGSRTEIVAGLHAGEQVIVRGLEDLQAGMAVVVGQYDQNGLKALPKITSSNRLAPSNQYQVRLPMEHLTLTMALDHAPPVIGKNNVTLSLTSLHGAVPSDISLEIVTVMPSMASMRVPKPSVQKTRPDRFKGRVDLIMPGLWEINVTVKQGGQTLASPVLEIEVPE